MKNTKLILTVGLSVILALMIVLATSSLLAYRSNIDRINTIVNHANLKVQYITEMRTYARERTISMQKMLLYKDDFDRDDEWVRFKTYAGEFIRNRLKYLDMDLSADEKRYINDLSKLSHQASIVQDKIASLTLSNQDDSARLLLTTKAIPIQDGVFNHISSILKSIEKNSKQAVKKSYDEFRNTVVGVLIITSIAILISIIIAKFLISRITRTERQLFNEKERAEITLYSIGDGALATDAKGNIEHINDMAASILGVSAATSIGLPLFKIFHLSDNAGNASIESIWSSILKDGQTVTSNTDSWLENKYGDKVAIEYSLSPIYDADKVITGTILIFRDVSEIRSLSMQLAFQAQHDVLTGLLNRRELETRIEETLAEVRRHNNKQHWLVYIDLDQFKVVNDTCGHLAGDELLKQVSSTIKCTTRETDHVSRLGGDEFAIIIKDCDIEITKKIVERFRKEIQDLRFCWEDKCFSISASIGVIKVTSDAGNMYDLMSKVDAACYLAKDEGRNRIHFVSYNDEAVTKQRGEMDWVHRIRHALDNNRFVLYYQTIKPIQNENEPFHAEILVRLFDDDNNLIPPNSFIPAAERYNLMTEIDRWVVTSTFKFIQEVGYESQIISINLSAQSLCDNDFVNFIIKSLDYYNINPSWVCFEITETAAISNLTMAKELIRILKEIGCKFSLDDFGSGLSSFGYLKNLPVDYLKIDGTFVKNITSDKIDLAMVNAINQVGHTMNIKTIAEYVEDEEIEIMLRTLKVDYAQGYGIKKPAPISDLLEEKPSQKSFL